MNELNIKGLKELEAALDRIPLNIEKNIARGAVRAGGVVFRDEARRLVPVTLDYVGFDIPDEFVVGYGLDYNQRFRNLSFIATLKHELLP